MSSNKFKFFIDAGHGGHDSGAVGPGLRESDVVLNITKKVVSKLTKDQNIVVGASRLTDVFHELSFRAALSNKFGANLFLSVHCNSAENPASGYEVFTTPGNTGADEPATRLFDAYGAKFPALKKRADISDGDPDKEAKFTVLTKTAAPAILLETEFIHTEAGAAFLASEDNQEAIADVIVAWVRAEAKRKVF